MYIDYVLKQVNKANMNLLKINNGNTRAMCEICLKLTRKRPERRQRLFCLVITRTILAKQWVSTTYLIIYIMSTLTWYDEHVFFVLLQILVLFVW